MVSFDKMYRLVLICGVLFSSKWCYGRWQIHFCRRQRGDLIEVFKILNSHYQIDPKDIFTLRQDSVTRGHQMKLFKKELAEALVNTFSTLE